MKTSVKFSLKLAAAAMSLVASLSSAHAYTIDLLIGQANLTNSSDQDELAAIRNLTGNQTLSLDNKVDINNNNLPALNPGPEGGYFIDVGTRTPGYFLLKFGTGNSGLNDTYFFQNIDELSKLVFTNEQVNFLTGGGNCNVGNGNGACNIGRLSHYDTFGGSEGGGGSTGNVPEPGTVALLGLGILGLTATRRRKAK